MGAYIFFLTSSVYFLLYPWVLSAGNIAHNTVGGSVR